MTRAFPRGRLRAATVRLRGSPLRLLAIAGAVGIAYFGASLALTDFGIVAAWWPPAGLTLGALLLTRRSNWPAILLAVAMAESSADAVHDVPAATIALWAAVDVLEPLLGALLLARLFRGRRVTLERVADLLRFAAGAGAAALLPSLLGALGAHHAWGDAVPQTAARWYFGDVRGIVTVAPLLLYARPILAASTRRYWATVASTTALVGVVVFAGPFFFQHNDYLALPVLAYAALAYGTLGAAPATFAATILSETAAVRGFGDFAEGPGNPHGLVELQVFTGVLIATVWLLAVATSDLRRAEREILHMQGPFWHGGEEGDVLPICMGCSRVETAGGWEPLALFFRERAEFLSHGYCPTCAEQYRRSEAMRSVAPRPGAHVRSET